VIVSLDSRYQHQTEERCDRYPVHSWMSEGRASALPSPSVSYLVNTTFLTCTSSSACNFAK